jgi:hypothetical protein
MEVSIFDTCCAPPVEKHYTKYERRIRQCFIPRRVTFAIQKKAEKYDMQNGVKI